MRGRTDGEGDLEDERKQHVAAHLLACAPQELHSALLPPHSPLAHCTDPIPQDSGLKENTAIIQAHL